MLSSAIASTVSLWRYPIKSMMGEEMNAADITERGLLGDRAYALVDSATGKVASAKHPRKWGRLFDCRAVYVEPLEANRALPSVRIALPDGAEIPATLPKDKPIYLHCRSGARSLKAAEILKAKGYDVRPLQAGYGQLVKDGFEKAE